MRGIVWNFRKLSYEIEMHLKQKTTLLKDLEGSGLSRSLGRMCRSIYRIMRI